MGWFNRIGLVVAATILVGCGSARMWDDTDRINHARYVDYMESVCKMEPNILQTKQRKKCAHQSEIRWAIFEWQECVKREIVPDCGEMPSWKTMPLPE